MFQKILPSKGKNKRRTNDYVDLSDKVETNVTQDADTLVYVAELNNRDDKINIEEQIYDGNIVIVELKYITSNGLSVEQIISEFKRVTQEVNGDIVQLEDEDRLIITPGDIKISREKI